eukprot:TRINITY_DN4787_c0_g2_i2.p1 TRINITY_DN4787_c0_g2~~TRINITY_DN4787_c0_g2_i2.p1  ORF type:complete len:682 (+),score=201.27 TRINITY_DN4787_c0_g2_i2:488-2533(+)
MHDAHTQYRKPGCYGGAFIIPLQLGSAETTGGSQIINVIPPFQTFANIQPVYDLVFPDAPSWSSLEGKQVVAIDGQPALDALKNFDAVMSKDAGSRFNSVLRTDFFLRDASGVPIPRKPVSITFEGNQTISFDWLSVWPKFKSDDMSTDGFKQKCAKPSDESSGVVLSSSSSPAAATAAALHLAEDHNPHQYTASLQAAINTAIEKDLGDKIKKTTVSTTTRSSANPTTLTTDTTTIDAAGSSFSLKVEQVRSSVLKLYYADYTLKDDTKSTRFCVVKIPSFSFPTTNTGDIDEVEWGYIPEYYQKLVDLQCQYLLFDVIANGGGVVAFGYRLMSLFIDGFSSTKDGDYDIISSDWVKEWMTFADSDDKVQNYLIDRKDFVDPKTHSAYPDVQALLGDGPTYTRGGVSSQYSNKGWLPFSGFKPWPKPAVQWPSSRMAIISDGTCGSTCALFVNKMLSVADVKTVAVGGLVGEPMSTSSFAGGNVLDANILEQVIQLLVSQGMDRTSSFPGDFPDSWYPKLTFSFREMYCYLYPDQVVEWQFIPADARVYNWALGDSDQYVSALKETFGKFDQIFNPYKCEEGTSVPCDEDGHVYVCNGGLLHTEECDAVPGQGPAGGPKDDKGASKFWMYTTIGAGAAAAFFLVLSIVYYGQARRARHHRGGPALMEPMYNPHVPQPGQV